MPTKMTKPIDNEKEMPLKKKTLNPANEKTRQTP